MKRETPIYAVVFAALVITSAFIPFAVFGAGTAIAESTTADNNTTLTSIEKTNLGETMEEHSTSVKGDRVSIGLQNGSVSVYNYKNSTEVVSNETVTNATSTAWKNNSHVYVYDQGVIKLWNTSSNTIRDVSDGKIASSGEAYPMRVTSNGTLIHYSNDGSNGRLVAYNPADGEIWNKSVPSADIDVRKFDVSNGVAYFASDFKLHAFDVEDGTKKWSTEERTHEIRRITAGDGGVYSVIWNSTDEITMRSLSKKNGTVMSQNTVQEKSEFTGIGYNPQYESLIGFDNTVHTYNGDTLEFVGNYSDRYASGGEVLPGGDMLVFDYDNGGVRIDYMTYSEKNGILYNDDSLITNLYDGPGAYITDHSREPTSDDKNLDRFIDLTVTNSSESVNSRFTVHNWNPSSTNGTVLEYSMYSDAATSDDPVWVNTTLYNTDDANVTHYSIYRDGEIVNTVPITITDRFNPNIQGVHHTLNGEGTVIKLKFEDYGVARVVANNDSQQEGGNLCPGLNFELNDNGEITGISNTTSFADCLDVGGNIDGFGVNITNGTINVNVSVPDNTDTINETVISETTIQMNNVTNTKVINKTNFTNTTVDGFGGDKKTQVTFEETIRVYNASGSYEQRTKNVTMTFPYTENPESITISNENITEKDLANDTVTFTKDVTLDGESTTNTKQSTQNVTTYWDTVDSVDVVDSFLKSNTTVYTINGVEYTAGMSSVEQLSEKPSLNTSTVQWRNIENTSASKFTVTNDCLQRPVSDGETNTIWVGESKISAEPNQVVVYNRTANSTEMTATEYPYPTEGNKTVPVDGGKTVEIHQQKVCFDKGYTTGIGSNQDISIPGLTDNSQLFGSSNTLYKNVSTQVGILGTIQQYNDPTANATPVSGINVDPFTGSANVTVDSLDRSKSTQFGETVSTFEISRDNGAVEVEIDDLDPNRKYIIYQDGEEWKTVTSDDEGQIRFTKLKGWSPHDFEVITGEEVNTSSSSNQDEVKIGGGSPGPSKYTLVGLAVLSAILAGAGIWYYRKKGGKSKKGVTWQ